MASDSDVRQAESELKDGLCHQAVLKPPNKAWDNRITASLRGVMEQLLRKIEHSDLGEGVIVRPQIAYCLVDDLIALPL